MPPTPTPSAVCDGCLTWVSGMMGLSSGDVLYKVERGVARMRGLGLNKPVR